MGAWIRQQLIREVAEARFFSILADETTDCSNREQLTLVFRFVDGENQIREEFFDFIEAPSTTGEALADLLLTQVRMYGLDPSMIRGQGYDGAANMCGKQRGAATRISQQFPLALYVHCSAHVLNLCIVKACEIQVVRNVLGTMIEIGLFFNYSAKRQVLLEKHIGLCMPESKKKKLVDLCRTRWVERHEAFESFSSLIKALVHSFEEIVDPQSNWSSDTTATAKGLMLSITQFDFLITFVVTKKCLAYIKGLSISLQTRSKDICEAFSDIKCVQLALENARAQVETFHATCFQEAIDMSESVGAPGPALPRVCNRQRHRCNIPADSPQEYYRRVVTVPFLDHLCSQMEERFSTTQQKAYMGLSLVPDTIRSDKEWRERVKNVASLYESDLPSPLTLQAELDLWESKWSLWEGDLPSSPQSALNHCSNTLFPNIHTLLKILCTLPITTSECERTFSSLKRLKTYTRSTMRQERLSGLALMHIHQRMKLDMEEILNIFARKYPRKLKLIDILATD